MPRKSKPEETVEPTPTPAKKPEPAPEKKPEPEPAPVVAPAVPRPIRTKPMPPRPLPPSLPAQPAAAAVKPTREALLSAIGQMLLRRLDARHHVGVRVYNEQGKVILEGGADFVVMCLETSDPAYRAMVEDAFRVEGFTR